VTEKYEGKCSKYGYIRAGSIEIVKISMGTLRMFSLNGDVVFRVVFRADVSNPIVGQSFSAKVLNVNKFGILAAAGLTDSSNNNDAFDTFVPIIDIVVPKTGTIHTDASIDLNTIKRDDVLLVELLGKKFTLNDTKISAIGCVKGIESQSLESPVHEEIEDIQSMNGDGDGDGEGDGDEGFEGDDRFPNEDDDDRVESDEEEDDDGASQDGGGANDNIRTRTRNDSDESGEEDEEDGDEISEIGFEEDSETLIGSEDANDEEDDIDDVVSLDSEDT
jgi:DNA-directed RNA polymerase subunit E'/Rpb7